MGFRPSRRFIQACLTSLILGILAGVWAVPQRTRADSAALFFASTGHRLSDEQGFLSYWRSSNGPLTLGPPISEPLADGALTVQYFALGRLELHPEYDNAIVRGRLGAEYSAALFRSFAAPAGLADQPGLRFFAETGHALGEPFRAFWEANGGMDAFGFPISAPAWEYVGPELLQVQYFERARLEYHPLSADSTWAVQISALGRDLARLRGIATAPADPQGALSVGDDGLPLPLPLPAPAPAAPAPAAKPAATAKPAAPAAKPAVAAKPAAPAPAARGGRYIIVDLSDQWLYAYEGDAMVYDAPVSTGRDGFNTPVGTFAVYAKLKSQTMQGTLGGEYYRVPNVPNVMYIVGGVAIHGTYWHNRFGTGARLSHGCINVGITQAAWLYAWAPMGTPVTVRW
ncbi:L,D-transpeptidase [Oscillochloris sp. ZM17-4]|uniref:L,D-transpeptidase n=1 Tax=Oscillochloris sp. ZM17-4 TaxID=2866714 RepID=UPI001C738550|nr:L,D-transpeptidase [Oscillochloris sp. ZM17-4]MBX0326556.1 L,D-transpeptidase [Oscillochloris sp. ZM17-4]